MSRSPEEIKKWHDAYYDADIQKSDTDSETWMHDFGSDAIFRVCFWDRDENKWSTYMGEYKIWQVIELPNMELMIGWRPIEEEGLFNSIEYRMLNECQIMHYPEKPDEDDW